MNLFSTGRSGILPNTIQRQVIYILDKEFGLILHSLSVLPTSRIFSIYDFSFTSTFKAQNFQYVSLK